MSRLSRSEAEALLTKVPFKDRLNVGRMVMPSGIHREQVDSLREAYWFLTPTKKTLPAVDFDQMAHWLETTIGDAQTAGELCTLCKNAESYVESCRSAYELIGARIAEAEEALNNDQS